MVGVTGRCDGSHSAPCAGAARAAAPRGAAPLWRLWRQFNVAAAAASLRHDRAVGQRVARLLRLGGFPHVGQHHPAQVPPPTTHATVPRPTPFLVTPAPVAQPSCSPRLTLPSYPAQRITLPLPPPPSQSWIDRLLDAVPHPLLGAAAAAASRLPHRAAQPLLLLLCGTTTFQDTTHLAWRAGTGPLPLPPAFHSRRAARCLRDGAIQVAAAGCGAGHRLQRPALFRLVKRSIEGRHRAAAGVTRCDREAVGVTRCHGAAASASAARAAQISLR